MVLGRAPKGVQGQCHWWGPGAPLKLKAFCTLLNKRGAETTKVKDLNETIRSKMCTFVLLI